MKTKKYPYEPDYATPPGLVIQEYLEAKDMSPVGLARRCGCPQKLMDEIIAGESGIEPEIASQLEKALGMSAEAWLSMEKIYRSRLAQIAKSPEHET